MLLMVVFVDVAQLRQSRQVRRETEKEQGELLRVYGWNPKRSRPQQTLGRMVVQMASSL